MVVNLPKKIGYVSKNRDKIADKFEHKVEHIKKAGMLRKITTCHTYKDTIHGLCICQGCPNEGISFGRPYKKGSTKRKKVFHRFFFRIFVAFKNLNLFFF